jgi:methionyl-tRNA formyltransferase
VPQICEKPDHPESKLRVVFFGTPLFASRFLEGLLNDSYFDVVGVVTQPDEHVGRKKVLTAPPTKTLALEECVTVFQPTKLKDEEFVEAIRALKADIFVIVAYGRILPEVILNIPKLGSINVHPSLLPKWRGPSPLHAAIAAGDEKSGVSIMKIDEAMDHGPLLAQAVIDLAADETVDTLTEKVVHTGVPLLIDSLKAYHAGSLTPVDQEHAAATYCTLLTREDGVITAQDSAEAIERKVRAYTPWPSVSTTWHKNGEAVGIKIFAILAHGLGAGVPLASGEVAILDDRLFLGTATTPIEILELQPASGKRMKASDFIKGYKDITG